MIRDPSDGSVREKPKPEVGIPTSKPSPDTGLRQPTRTDAQERLEKSREFVRDYHAKKEREHARGSNDTKLPQAGHPVEGQREAES